MHPSRRALHVVLGTVAFMVVGSSAAWAPGSIMLDEVMDQLKANQKLIDEIRTELKAQNLQPDAVTCIGARFGGHWVDLGGARSVPYTCDIGKKTLSIDGTLHLYDERGNEVDMNDEKAPERAFDYKQTDLTWSWK